MLHHMKNELRKHYKPRFEKSIFMVHCDRCGKEFEVEERIDKFPSKSKYYCCRSCANSHKRTDESKQKSRESLNKYWESRGRKPLKHHICEICGSIFYTKKSTSRFCSETCRRKYLRGSSNKTKLEQYRSDCQFKFSLNEFPEEFDFDLINKYGWYKAKNHGDNLYGVSRDHMVSVLYGFEHDIDPSIISHPANCQLLIHSKNSSKGYKCSITYDELLKRIEQWDKKYGPYIQKGVTGSNVPDRNPGREWGFESLTLHHIYQTG